MPFLARALGHADAEVIKAALLALGEQGPAAELAIASVLDHARWDVRSGAVKALARALGPQATSRLEERLACEADPSVREAIASSLGEPRGERPS